MVTTNLAFGFMKLTVLNTWKRLSSCVCLISPSTCPQGLPQAAACHHSAFLSEAAQCGISLWVVTSTYSAAVQVAPVPLTTNAADF